MALRFRPLSVALLLAACFPAAPARAAKPELQPIQLLASDVTVDPLAQTITFALTFDRRPRLQDYDSYINAADEFSIDILNEPLSQPVLTGAGGEDLRLLSSQYRVDDPTVLYGRVPTPEGFAAITTPRYDGSYLLDLVPFRQTGRKIKITTTFAQLHETDGLFEAVLETYRYGAWGGTTYHIGTVFPDPLPTDIVAAPEPAGLAPLAAAALALLVRRKRPPR